MSVKESGNLSMYMGSVKRVSKNFIHVQLPDYTSGVLVIEESNRIFTNIYNHNKNESTNKSINFHSSKFFKKDMLVACVKEDVPDDSMNINISIDPFKIYRNLDKNKLSIYETLWGYICSAEDHGYEIEFGIEDFKGFYKTSDKLPVGHFSFFTISSFSSSKKVAVVGKDHLISSNGSKIQTSNIFPANIIYNEVTKINKNTVTVQITPTLTGEIDENYSHLANAKKIEIGEKVFCRILSFDSNSNLVKLTNSPHLVALNSDAFTSTNVNEGDFVECKIKKETEEGYFVLIINSNLYGFIPHTYKEYSTLPCKVGDILKMRVYEMNPINGVVILSNQQNYMNEKYVNIKQLVPGLKCDGKVIKIMPHGYQVAISKYLSGFIYKYLATENSEISINVGSVLKCRIMYIQEEQNKLLLSANPSIVHSSLPIIDSYNISPDAFSNQYLGFVEKCEKSYCIIKFFNNVSGLLHKSEMVNVQKNDDLSKIYSIGTVLNVSIISCDAVRKRIVLSLKQKVVTELSNDNIIVLSNPDVQEKYVRFQLNNNDQTKYLCSSVIVPFPHLSDFHEHINLILHIIKNRPTQFTKRAVFLGIDFEYPNEKIATFKYSIIRSVELDIFPSQFKDIKLGQYLAGFILKVTKYGMDIRIGINITGFLPRSKIGNADAFLLNQKFFYGQSGLFYVEELDEGKNRIILSLAKNATLKSLTPNIPNHIHGHGLLLSYFKDFDFISSMFFFDPDSKITSDIFVRGKKISVKVKKSKGDCYFVKTIIGSHHGTLFPCGTVKISSVIEATLIYWTFDPLYLYFVEKTNDSSEINNHLKKVVKINILKQFDRFAIGAYKNNDLMVPSLVVCKETLLDTHITSNADLTNKPQDCICQSILDKCLVVTPLTHKSLGIGSSYVNCTITSILACNMKVTTDGENKAFIHVSNISQTVREGDRPLERFNIGDKLDAFVCNRPSKSQKYLAITHNHDQVRQLQLSLKPRIDTTLEKINKTLNDGELVVGFIKVFGTRYVSIEVSPYIRGILSIIDLKPVNESFNDPIDKFVPGTAVNLYTRSYDLIARLYKFSRLKTYPDVKIDDIIIGRVYKHHPINGILLDFPNYKNGYISFTNTSDEYSSNVQEKYPIGACISCKVLKILNDTFALSTRDSHLSKSTVISDPYITSINQLKGDSKIRGYLTKITKSHIYVALSENIVGRIKVKDAFKKLGKGWNKNFKPFSLISCIVQNIINDKMVDILPLASIKATVENLSVDCAEEDSVLKVGERFDWNSGEFIGVSTHKRKHEDIAEDVENPSSKKKIEIKPLNEKEVRNIEHKLASNKMIPVTSEDFDRLIIASPNSSVLWINYMAFYLQSMELDKTRMIGQRALNSVMFSEEKERLNIWIALINIECLYGTTDSLRDTYEEAKKVSNKKKIIQHMIEMYTHLNKLELAEKECTVLIKTFPHSKMSYVYFARILTKLHRYIQTKQLLNQALKNISEKKHVDCIVQFALCEFNFGDVQRGSTIIESVLQNFPSRIDVWSVYIDQLIKHSNIDQARNCFERVITLKLRKNKIQGLLNKYIAFESKNGTPQSVLRIEQLMSN